MIAPPSILPHRAPRRAFWKLLLTETKLAWREPMGLVWGLGFPVLLLVIFGSIPAFKKPSPVLGGLTFLSVYIPILIAFTLAMLALVGLTTPLAAYREQDVLRRMSTTPVPPLWVLAAQLVINLVLAAAALFLIIMIGVAAFGVHGPKQVPGFLVSVLLTAAALFAIGLWVACGGRQRRQDGHDDRDGGWLGGVRPRRRLEAVGRRGDGQVRGRHVRALHLAVNNAGIGGPTVLTGEYPVDGWDKVIAINLSGVFLCLCAELPRYLRDRLGLDREYQLDPRLRRAYAERGEVWYGRKVAA